MRRQLLNVAITLSLCLMLGVAATAQMTKQVTVNIPFAFYVGKTALPAGTYTLYSTSAHTGNAFLLRGADGKASVAFNAQQVQGESRSVGRLEFRRYGEKYFLGEVWSEGSNIGNELHQSRLERETARDASHDLAKKDMKLEIVTISQ